MNTFDEQVCEHQVQWRHAAGLPTNEHGLYNGEPYPWILPPQFWEYGLWPGIRSGSECSLPNYLRDERIQRHTGSNNLKSSWVACANLYFPFRHSQAGLELLAGFLQRHVSSAVQTVDAVELEYAELGDCAPSQLLGEAGGSRGSGQTSPDVAFLVNGGRGLILTESKYSEHSFYSCSAKTHACPRRPSTKSSTSLPRPTTRA
ncbi:MAG: hypothetical protein H0T51_15560 [Pirellulales bacterium]|nr:hypothetical protein [Pirellulales bacterium]